MAESAQKPGRASRRLAVLCITALAVSGLLTTTPAHASPVTVGQLSLPNSTTDCTDRTTLQTGVGSGASYVVPFAGVITSWSFEDGSIAVTGLKLKVGRPAGGLNYTIIGEATAPGTQTAISVNGPYPVDIPVSAGDVIGIYSTGGRCTLVTGVGSDTQVSKAADVAPGTTLVPDLTSTGALSPVSVQVQPPPGINLTSTSSGSIVGGTSVTIAGHDFLQVGSVSFGSTPASFVVDSDTEITAVSPRVAAPGPVDIRVTTIAGTSSEVGADRFTYLACVVPNLIGKKLKKQEKKKKISGAGCKLGKVKGHGKRVRKQSVKPGTILPPGSTINVKLR